MFRPIFPEIHRRRGRKEAGHLEPDLVSHVETHPGVDRETVRNGVDDMEHGPQGHRERIVAEPVGGGIAVLGYQTVYVILDSRNVLDPKILIVRARNFTIIRHSRKGVAIGVLDVELERKPREQVAGHGETVNRETGAVIRHIHETFRRDLGTPDVWAVCPHASIKPHRGAVVRRKIARNGRRSRCGQRQHGANHQFFLHGLKILSR